MKRIILIGLIISSVLLSACSFIGEVNNSLDYVTTATEHIENLNAFAEEAPQLISDAATNQEVRAELETELIRLKADVEEFIQLSDIPTVVEDVHQDFVAKNELLLAEIDKVLENGHVALDKLENSQLFNTLTEVTNLINRIESLGL
ncbi:DUF6376 family protein [Cytobacillus sp. FJAT-54145]|uniref:DUF6376 family protein n=1 Tax=Cytobacillus spartinae TaxID=3299023 RepID=A0ABW6K4T2_9BACI